MSAATGLQATLDDKYLALDGPVLLGGIQALVRVVLDQRRHDRERGWSTAGFVSGYQGSPLAGVDREMQRAHDHLTDLGVVFQPGLNEELAATAVGGTQLLGELAGRRYEGVTGYWYGKSPGLDRAADAIRHANLSGTAPRGGAVAWIGDDPSSKSSTVPSACEPMCRSLLVPVLAPGSVQELLELGLHAVALSRHAGVWAAVKIVADVADAMQVVELPPGGPEPAALDPRMPSAALTLLPPSNLDAEEDLVTVRLARALDYAREAGLNHVLEDPSRPRLAVAAAGTAFQAVLRAFALLGIDAAARDALGVRLVQIRMPWPLDPGFVREVATDVDTILVVEDKLGFVEGQIKEALYRSRHAPLVVGKQDADGAPLLSVRSALTADDVVRALGRLLPPESLADRARAHLDRLSRPENAGRSLQPVRTPYFCSGCPHNASTRADADRLVGVGIGCHTMVAMEGGSRRGHLLGITQMGGEGAQWLGLAPFTQEGHFTQNVGDGTFHHSGSLAIRAAVAAGATMTYRLLYNDAVAMTGGQRPEGRLPVPELTRWLALEGVARTIVTTPEPERYRRVKLDPTASVRHRDDLAAAAEELSAVSGVTVLLHDDRCATEKRRLRKRGALPVPKDRVWINERVCEGCGDCGDQSSCLSVVPVDTAFGRKTRIHQGSCNHDRSCLKGDCPSFLLVTPSVREAPTARPELPVALVAPVRRTGADVLVRMPGVGGSGVVTVSQILQMAAHLEGRYAAGLEQVGLAQKGGPVLSDLRFSATPIQGLLRASAAEADVLVGLDLLGAAQASTLHVCDPERTIAVLNTAVTPTAGMVIDADAPAPSARRAVRDVARATRSADLVTLDAHAIAHAVFGDDMPANMIMAGAAFQHGCLPVSAEAVAQAIALNGTAVEANLAAFAWGRAAIIDPGAVRSALFGGTEAPVVDPWIAGLLDEHDLHGAVRDTAGPLAAELRAFQDERLAATYVGEVAQLFRAERQRVGTDTGAVTLAYARGLHKLLAYKDEYEVARLHLLEAERARRHGEFGASAQVAFLLHPPLLRALGVKRKLRCGRWIMRVFRLLVRARRLRGTRLDPFGRAAVRRVERDLPGEYRVIVERALQHLGPGTVDDVVRIVGLPDLVRGYEAIKLANVDRFRHRADEALAQLRVPPATRRVTTTQRQIA